MVHVKKNKFKPRFKKIINLKIVIQNKQKILKFKKKNGISRSLSIFV